MKGRTAVSPAIALKRRVRNLLSGVGEITKVELEGPFVVVYAKDPGVFMANSAAIIETAKTLRKKIIIEASKPLAGEEEVRKIIMELAPSNAEISAIIFVKETNQVYIIAKRTGYVVGKKGSNINMILGRSGWRPVIIRSPAIRSTFFEMLQRIIVDQSAVRRKNMRQYARRIYRAPLEFSKGITATFLGAAREVGRSGTLIRTGKSSVLLDAGIAVGGGEFFPKFDSPDFAMGDLDAIAITHAHLDHSGAIPLLVKHGYEGIIYSTKPTRDLTALLLHDYINVAHKSGVVPFFSEMDVATFLSQSLTLDYGEIADISPDIKLSLHNAGHILGSSMILLGIGEGEHNILYTGDFRYRDSRLLDKAEDRLPRVDTVIMECTYGGETDVFPPLPETEARLISVINDVIRGGGKVLIPALSVGRSTEVMLAITDAFAKTKLPDVPVFIDGMISDSMAIHTAYPIYLSARIREMIFKKDTSPLTETHITPVKGPSDREEIIAGGPSVIISPSGMLAGGPSVEYFTALAEDEKSTVILVSYQGRGTLGRRLMEGERVVTIPSWSGVRRRVNVKTPIQFIEGFSAHADRVQLLSFLARLNPKPKTVVLVHGEERKVLRFSSLVRRTFRSSRTRVIVPEILDRVRLD